MTGAIAAGQYSVATVIVASVQLHNQADFASTIGTATAAYTINADGNAYSANGGLLEAWLTGTGAVSSSYEVMATQTSGVTVSGTLGTWLGCGTSRTWSVVNSARNNSVITGVITVQIRDVATHTVQASASITLSAESDNLN